VEEGIWLMLILVGGGNRGEVGVWRDGWWMFLSGDL
jgi:hypothetical protein